MHVEIQIYIGPFSLTIASPSQESFSCFLDVYVHAVVFGPEFKITDALYHLTVGLQLVSPESLPLEIISVSVTTHP